MEKTQPIIDIPNDIDPNLGYSQETPPPKRRWLWVFIILDVVLITPSLIAAGVWYVYNQPDPEFTLQTIEIAPGSTVQDIAAQLAQADIVKSDLLLDLTLRLTQDTTQIQAGMYQFTTPLTTYEVAQHLTSGDIINEQVTLTFIEGESNAAFASRAAEILPAFDTDEFALLTADLEGSLFPETYFVPPDYTTAELVTLLTDKHDTVLDDLLANASTSLIRTQIVTLASIVEREANTPESMATVAGVFLNRIAIGMPLQADASIEYALQTPLGELPPGQLAAELRELDSPYNTYLNPGLPPTPIGNPGETALAAVISPIESDYFYYITGSDGEFYYAQTYDQHLINIAKHLR